MPLSRVCTCMCICVHVCGGQRSISDFISQESSTIYFWRQSLLLTWNSLFRQAWLTSKSPDSFAYTSPELGCVSTHQHTPEFWLGTGNADPSASAASTLPTPITPLFLSGKMLLIQWLVLHWTFDRQPMEPIFGLVVPLLVLT